MTDAELDQVYTALAQAIGHAGPEKTPLLLATLSLHLLSQSGDADRALAAIVQAQALI